MDALNASLYHGFLRRRFVPPRHQVVTEDVDRELITDDKDSKELSSVAAYLKSNNEEKEEKEEVWIRLNELTKFPIVGFVFFSVRIGDGAYNRERETTVLRQSATDRDALWDDGIRVHIGNRFRHASAALSLGLLARFEC